MSSGLKLDRADTAYAEKAHELSIKNRNWLRHGKGTTAGKIDEMLLVSCPGNTFNKCPGGIALHSKQSSRGGAADVAIYD